MPKHSEKVKFDLNILGYNVSVVIHNEKKVGFLFPKGDIVINTVSYQACNYSLQLQKAVGSEEERWYCQNFYMPRSDYTDPTDAARKKVIEASKEALAKHLEEHPDALLWGKIYECERMIEIRDQDIAHLGEQIHETIEEKKKYEQIKNETQTAIYEMITTE